MLIKKIWTTKSKNNKVPSEEETNNLRNECYGAGDLVWRDIARWTTRVWVCVHRVCVSVKSIAYGIGYRPARKHVLSDVGCIIKPHLYCCYVCVYMQVCVCVSQQAENPSPRETPMPLADAIYVPIYGRDAGVFRQFLSLVSGPLHLQHSGPAWMGRLCCHIDHNGAHAYMDTVLWLHLIDVFDIVCYL